jgi:hypothetical protein
MINRASMPARLGIAALLAMSVVGCRSGSTRQAAPLPADSRVAATTDTGSSPTPSPTARTTDNQEWSQDPQVPADQVHRVCRSLSAASLSRGSGHQWVYHPEASRANIANSIDSTRGADCNFKTADSAYELDVWVLLTPFPANTIKTDFTEGVLELIPVEGIGSEAYAESAGRSVAGTGVGELLVRADQTWFSVALHHVIGTDGSSEPGGTLPQVTAVAAAVIAAHPSFSQ